MKDSQRVFERFTNFMNNVKHLSEILQSKYPESVHLERKWNSTDHRLFAAFTESQNKVRESLEDNFDTATTIKVLQDLVKSCNEYIIPGISQITSGGITKNSIMWPTKISEGIITNNRYNFFRNFRRPCTSNFIPCRINIELHKSYSGHFWNSTFRFSFFFYFRFSLFCSISSS
jgi:hypothetical protein